MRISINTFNEYIDRKLLRRQTTEDGSLIIWNYAHKAQYENVWDDVTTLARGLITSPDGTIMARSFRKFFNLGERPETYIENLPENENPVVTEKLDGYLGLSYWHCGRVKVASRGSFTSEYAVWATEWLRNRCQDIDTRFTDKEYTLVFEIIYPNRRIAVNNSGRYGLFLLAVVNTSTGEEMQRGDVEAVGKMFDIPVVEIFQTRTVAECIEAGKLLDGTSMEGFVVQYPTAGLRVKIKGDDYCRIHRIATKLTKRRVWEIFARDETSSMSGVADPEKAWNRIGELAKILPEEYSDWLFNAARQLCDNYFRLSNRAKAAADACRPSDPMPMSNETRKAVVQRLQAVYPVIWLEALHIIDGQWQRAVKSFWNRIKPEHEMPLLRDGEDE